MQPRLQLIIALPLVSAILFGESPITEISRQPEAHSYTYSGDIVNANCYQAAEIVNRNSRGYNPVATRNAFVPGNQKVVANASPKKKKEKRQ